MFESGVYLFRNIPPEDFLADIRNPMWSIDLNEECGQYNDASIFLQGACHLFAYVLNEQLGYTIFEIRYGRCCHYFAHAETNGESIYVDVRGGTSDWLQFLSGLKYFPDSTNVIKREVPSNEICEELKKCKANGPETFGYRFAVHVIEKLAVFYTIGN